MPKEFKFSLILFNLYILFFHIPVKILESDNHINLYEYNIDFSKFEPDIKAIAIYYPSINLNIIKNKKPIDIKYDQPRTRSTNITQNINKNLNIIKNQIQLAKSHGIYGFAISYNGSSGKNEMDDIFDIFNNNEINFHFFLTLEDDNYKKLMEDINNQELKEEFFETNFKNIKKFIMLPNYIKINKMPALGIYITSDISITSKVISIFQKYSLEYGIGQLMIFGFLNEFTNITKIEDFQKLESFKLVLMFPQKKYKNEDKIKNQYFSFYNYLLYEHIKLNNETRINNYYRCSILGYHDSQFIFNDFSPEIFYILNKIIINYTKHYFNNSNQIFFINSWNNWNKGSYLEPDEKYGYASLNSLSKSIYNLSYINIITFKILNEKCILAVHVHIYYEELIGEIIEKTNNIPIKFDLFISTDSTFKKEFIIKKIKNRTKANYHEIKIFKNKGRDVLPFILQIKNVIRNYKYICHLHTKKSVHCALGDEWRSYLFNNLLGSTQIVSEILSDFEMSDNLGIIFPEIFYKILLSLGKNLIYKFHLLSMNYLIRKINPGYKIIEKKSDFPVGNMFWARTIAIHQIFEENIEKKFTKEKGQIDFTIMHSIERIWVYIAKLNGYYYKKVFKHL